MQIYRTAFAALALFSSFQLQALPSIPKARPETEPKIPSSYQLCPTPLNEQSEDVLFACAEEEYWYGFSDGRLKPRLRTEKTLGTLMQLTQKSSNTLKRGRLLALRGYLRLALALENGQIVHVLNGGLERDFKAAKVLDSENKIYDTFLDTVIMAKAAVWGNWKKASALAIPAFDLLVDNPTNILALSGTTIGFPMTTGLPQKTIEFLDAWQCPDDIAAFCHDNTVHAPFARPGLAFHFAESYARMGMEEKARHYMEEARRAPGYENWQYKDLVEKPMADMATYMAYWKSFKPGDSAFDKVYANQNFGCVMCHGR